MKKTILISLIAIFSVSVMAFSFANSSPEPAPAPVTWNYFIHWDDSECNCISDDARLDWEVYHVTPFGNVLIASAYAQNINPLNTPYEVTGSNNIVSGDDYIITGSVIYYDDNEEPCCKGKKKIKVKGSALIADGTNLYIIMQ